METARRQHAIPDLGPDIDRVGPGQPHWDTFPKERAIKHEPLEGGSIVALKKGKELAGFATLQAAFEKAPTVDTFEIRTDRRIEGAVLPAERGRVTIRAGYGYHPRVKSLGVEKGCQLSAEGFTLDKDAHLHIREGSWIVRLAHLSGGDVKGPGSPDVKAPTEVTACLVRTLDLYSGTVNVKDCVLMRQAPSAATVRNKFLISLDRCLVTNRTAEFALVEPFLDYHEKGHQWSVRRTLVDSNEQVIHHINPKMWTGERNVYRTAFTIVGGRFIPDLDTFREWMGSPETGSVIDRCSAFDPNEWALRDEVRKDLGGKEYGADVSRILAPPPAIKPQAVKPDADKPFVVVRKGGAKEEFKTIAGALAALRVGPDPVVTTPK